RGGARCGLVEPVVGGRLGRVGAAARPSEVLPAFHAELRVRRVALPAARACGHGGPTLTSTILTDPGQWRRCAPSRLGRPVTCDAGSAARRPGQPEGVRWPRWCARTAAPATLRGGSS